MNCCICGRAVQETNETTCGPCFERVDVVVSSRTAALKRGLDRCEAALVEQTKRLLASNYYEIGERAPPQADQAETEALRARVAELEEALDAAWEATGGAWSVLRAQGRSLAERITHLLARRDEEVYAARWPGEALAADSNDERDRT